MPVNRPARVLTIAGSDSGGGAGIQADIKTITVLGGYASSTITSLTVQNTQGVTNAVAVSPTMVAEQITAVLEDIGADAIKIGMLHSEPIIKAVSAVLHQYPEIPVILDTVMLAKGGHSLLDADAIHSLIDQLFVRAELITPNIPEAEALVGQPIDDLESMKEAAFQLQQLGANHVLLKGGHLTATGHELTDLLLVGDEIMTFVHPRQDTKDTHGTGCTVSAAIATFIAQGESLPKAVEKAIDYIQLAIAHAPGLGKGHGPLGHNYMLYKTN